MPYSVKIEDCEDGYAGVIKPMPGEGYPGTIVVLGKDRAVVQAEIERILLLGQADRQTVPVRTDLGE